MRAVIIDNYDSFTYNLMQALWSLGAEVEVFRNDAISACDLATRRPDRIVLSPGPGRPEDAGICVQVVRELGGIVPILGVCLGHQVIGHAFGARIGRAGQPMHGRTSLVRHDGRGVFAGCPNPLEATRYHSLVVERRDLPPCLAITAESLDDAEVMGLRYLGDPGAALLEGVQFHPESYLTVAGETLLGAFLGAVPPVTKTSEAS